MMAIPRKMHPIFQKRTQLVLIRFEIYKKICMLALEENESIESPPPVLSLPWGPIHPQALAAQTQELQLRELLFTLDVDMIC